jgi:hypothetical protein
MRQVIAVVVIGAAALFSRLPPPEAFRDARAIPPSVTAGRKATCSEAPIGAINAWL